MQMGRMNPENKPRKIISSSLTQEVKLRTTENAWKPERIKAPLDANEETADQLIKRARGMLNKLTPQNFEKISNQFLGLKINTGEKLKRMIGLIFDKAVDEPAFCEQYAQLCKNMSTITVKPENENDKPIKFNTLLLEQCQTCFETDKYKDLNLEEKQREIDECKDKEKRQQMIEELDDAKRLVRKRSLGNIKLIGALYKNDRLKGEIMDLCIETLIANDDEDSYECLCSLLRSIGEKFEKGLKPNQRPKFNAQMKQLESIVRENKIASRIKFLIMDILDMRRDGWRVRKLQEGTKPKTIEEVHEDLKKREEAENREISQGMGKNRGNDSIKKRTNDNWMQSSSRKSQQSTTDTLSNLRKIHEQRASSSDNQAPQLNLGPQSFGPRNFGSWSQVSAGGLEHSGSALPFLVPSQLDHKLISTFFFLSLSQGASAPKQQTTSTGSNSDRKVNHWQSRVNANQVDQAGSKPSSPKRSPFRGSYSPDNDEREMQLLTTYQKIIKAYISSNELDECVDSIYEHSTEESTHLFVVSAIDQACESLLKSINQIGELLATLVLVKKIITPAQFHKG